MFLRAIQTIPIWWRLGWPPLLLPPPVFAIVSCSRRLRVHIIMLTFISPSASKSPGPLLPHRHRPSPPPCPILSHFLRTHATFLSHPRQSATMYSSRCSGGRRMAPSFGYIFTDRVSSIPSLHCRYRPDRFLLRNRNTKALHTQHPVTFTHISNPILFHWSSRGTQSVVKHSSSRFTFKFFFFGCRLPATGPPMMSPQPYRNSKAQGLAYFGISYASATGSTITRFTGESRRIFCQPELGLEEQPVTSRSISNSQ